MNKKYVLKNGKRFSIFIGLILVIAVSLISVVTVYGYKTPQYKVISVRNGDTLWSIATKYIKSGDVRENVYKLQTANNLSGTDIYFGMEIRIPVSC